MLAACKLALSFLAVASVTGATSTDDHPSQGCESQAPVEVDVVVVGGGYSGLMSAYELDRAGMSTVVLEARDRIGGRSRSITRQSGPGIIELGATWINNKTQPQVFALTERFGLETAVQWTDGDAVYQGPDGVVLRQPAASNASTTDPELAEAELLVLGLIETAVNQTDIRRHDAFPVDQDVTLEEWLIRNGEGLWDIPHVRFVVTGLVSALVGREPHEIGAHYIFDYIKSGGGLRSLSSEDQNGAQYLKIKQGTTAIATGLADALARGTVYTSTPVEAITQSNGTVIVTSSTGKTFSAKKAILAIPTNTYRDITFSPPLPCQKETIVSQTKPGIYAKLIVSYSEPWWRDAGLLGEFTSAIGPVCFSWDTSDLDINQHSLALFVSGSIATSWHELPDSERQESIIEHLAVLAGDDLADRARETLEINYIEWTKEDHIFGGPTSSIGPGLLRKYGAAMRQPFGSLHFGGGDLSYEWKGYLEGAILRGQTAANEVMAALEV